MRWTFTRITLTGDSTSGGKGSGRLVPLIGSASPSMPRAALPNHRVFLTPTSNSNSLTSDPESTAVPFLSTKLESRDRQLFFVAQEPSLLLLSASIPEETSEFVPKPRLRPIKFLYLDQGEPYRSYKAPPLSQRFLRFNPLSPKIHCPD